MRTASSLLTVFASILFVSVLVACSGASNPLNGGQQDCQTVPCGNGGASYTACVTPGSSSGGCGTTTYTVGGQSFTCSTCGGQTCTQAAEQVEQACANPQPTGDGGSPTGDGGRPPNETCSAQVACGTSGKTYEECTDLSATGTCEAIVYRVSDGKSFTCAGCADCQGTAEELQGYCTSSPAGDGGGPTTMSCTSSVPCGDNGTTYEECETETSGGACISITYEVSDGSDFACNACSDCSSAVSALDAHCGQMQQPTTTCSPWQSCEESSLSIELCTTSEGSSCQSQYYETSDGEMFLCNSCNDCSGALGDADNYCTNMGQPTTSCGSAEICGGEGETYSFCTVSTGGVCSSSYYQATDGTEYECNSCNDCTTAEEDIQSYCNEMQTTSTSCGASEACGTGGVTYQDCTVSTGGTCTNEYYVATDGTQYDCTACGNCSTAATDMVDYCAEMEGVACGSVTCDAGEDLCCDCSGVDTCETSDGGTFTCASYGCE